MASVAFVHTSIKAISNCRQKTFPQPVIQSRHSCIHCCHENSKGGSHLVQMKGEFLRKVIYLLRNYKGMSKVLSGGFCVHGLKALQKALHFLHIYCPNVNSYSTAPESNEQNPPNESLDLHFFFRYKQIILSKSLPLPASSANLPHWF